LRKGEPPGFVWSYRDLLWALVITFMAMSVLALVVTTQQRKTLAKPQANLLFTLHWDDASNSDVDLWVQAPGETPVGYLHEGDTTANLVRDDLGRKKDKKSRNQEMTMARGTPAGEWVVNVVLYASYDRRYPVKATAEVLKVGVRGAQTLVSRAVALSHEGQQITVARFTLDADGNLVPGSVNDLPMSLYARQIDP
jgi:hypothetical protein